MYRQGDLLFVEASIPGHGAEQVDDGIVARGEVTGHTHRIRPGTQAALLIAAGIAYIRALQETPIDHEEHDTVILPVGDWQVIRQREYQPDGWRQVED
jgi:hypothetical protein